MQQLTKLLTPNTVRLAVQVNDWQEAVRIAGDILIADGAIDSSYVEEAEQVAREMGPYFIVRPGVALAHARPGPNVHKVCLSLISLVPPIAFGHPDNDPVSLLFMFGSLDNVAHISLLSELASLFSNETLIQSLQQAKTYEDLQVVLKILSNDN
jgi:mannitol/fructose-specific phosphotransferase system IIA component (Ntr-type)